MEPAVKSAMADLPERAVRPLIREKDPEIKEKVIQSVRKSVKTGKNPSTGRFTKKSKEQQGTRTDLKSNIVLNSAQSNEKHPKEVTPKSEEPLEV